nr:GNAT family protein [Allomuricauda sp.]
MHLDFAKDYVLENERVSLLPLKVEHVEPLAELAKEEHLWTYFLGRSDGSADFEFYIKNAIGARKEQKEYPFAVFDNKLQKFAGCTRYFDYQQDLNTIRLGYTWYGQEFRGIGLNKNCKYLMFQFAFEQLGLERVGLGAHAENQISLAAMKSIGCSQEGVIRNMFPSIQNNGRADAILLSMLKAEWLDTKKEKLRHRL